MTEPKRRLHLNAFLRNIGQHEAAWRLPISDTWSVCTGPPPGAGCGQAAGAFAGRKLDARDEFDLRYADLGPESPVAGPRPGR